MDATHPFGVMTVVHSSGTRVGMAALVVIGYADQGLAEDARKSVQALEDELAIRADQVASISRDIEGRYHAHTSHGGRPGTATWSGSWESLFGMLFFDVSALLGPLGKSGLDKTFQERVREQVKPGTSALFMVVEQAAPDKAVTALESYGGTVIKASLSSEEVERLRRELSPAPSAEVTR